LSVKHSAQVRLMWTPSHITAVGFSCSLQTRAPVSDIIISLRHVIPCTTPQDTRRLLLLLHRVGGSRLCFWDLRLALKDLRLDLRLEHKDLRLTRDLTLKTRNLLATCKSLCYSRVVIKDELGNISTQSGDGRKILMLGLALEVTD